MAHDQNLRTYIDVSRGSNAQKCQRALRSLICFIYILLRLLPDRRIWLEDSCYSLKYLLCLNWRSHQFLFQKCW